MDKILYVYEEHCGGDDYVSDRELSDEELYCEMCNDSDTLIFHGTREEILKELKRNINKAKRRLKKAVDVDERLNAEVDLDNAISEYQYIGDLINQYCWKELEKGD